MGFSLTLTVPGGVIFSAVFFQAGFAIHSSPPEGSSRPKEASPSDWPTLDFDGLASEGAAVASVAPPWSAPLAGVADPPSLPLKAVPPLPLDSVMSGSDAI